MTLDFAAACCAPMGSLEFVVESRSGENMERWFVVRPHKELGPRYRELGFPISNNCRVVVEAESLRPVAVLESASPAVPLSSGFNPYFDLPAA